MIMFVRMQLIFLSDADIVHINAEDVQVFGSQIGDNTLTGR